MSKIEQNSKCKLCGDMYETINNIETECKKTIVQKEFMTWQDSMEKVILLEWSKKLKIYHTTKWYLHKPQS